MANILNIATVQFANHGNIPDNCAKIQKFIEDASDKNADIIHFSENSLSGYFGIDRQSHLNNEQDVIEECILKIKATCKKQNIFAIIGSHYFDHNEPQPYISLIVIDPKGEIQTRYDKRFLFGKRKENDHKYYQSGREFKSFTINNIKCGLLICHEWRYPELYREQTKNGIDIVFHSWYDGGYTDERYETEAKHNGELIVGSVKGYAVNNHLWVSGSNTSRSESSFASFIISPDGRIYNQAKRNIEQVMITKIDFDMEFDDPSKDWRVLAMNGILTNK